VTGCWFDVTQSIIKRVHKLGFKDEYTSESDVKDIVRCVLGGLPLLPADEICPAFDEVKLTTVETNEVSNDSRFVNKLNDLLRYAGRHWTQKRSTGLVRLCAVITGTEQTSRKASMLHSNRIQVTHPKVKGKRRGLDTCYSATYMSQTRDQQCFTISEVAADWHKPMVPQRIMWPSIAHANGQLDPRCS